MDKITDEMIAAGVANVRRVRERQQRELAEGLWPAKWDEWDKELVLAVLNPEITDRDVVRAALFVLDVAFDGFGR